MLTWRVAFGTVALALMLAGCEGTTASSEARNPPTDAAPAATHPPAASSPEGVITVGPWRQPDGLEQMPIWPGDAPNQDGVQIDPESVLTRDTPEAIDGPTSQAIFNVSTPTMTVFPARGRNTGAAIIVFPGGGFRTLAVTIEGTEICNWVTSRGMTCILSKYRVPYTNHSWNPELRRLMDPRPAPALQDAQRTIRLVRSRAEDLGIDPDRIGVMGFSAGGYLVAQSSNILEPVYTPVDQVDQISSRPDFAIAFFPGHICRDDNVFDPNLTVIAQAPPTFLLQAWDDPVDPICNSLMYASALNRAGVPSEVHLFATGGHAFGLRRNHSPDTVWPALLETWLAGIGVLPSAED